MRVTIPGTPHAATAHPNYATPNRVRVVLDRPGPDDPRAWDDTITAVQVDAGTTQELLWAVAAFRRAASAERHPIPTLEEAARIAGLTPTRRHLVTID